LLAAAPKPRHLRRIARGIAGPLSRSDTLVAHRLAWWLTGGAVGRSELPRPVSFTQAALFQAVNPKSWIKAVTLASVFMPVGFQPAAGALLVSVIGLAIGLPCISLWALFGVAIGRFLSSPRRQRVFNAIMGAALAVLALLLIR
jgi:threonine/homoserine/homoserine lactone efflux protein